MSLVVPDHKTAIRARVWADLRTVAVPDSRFHFDFSSFIADFSGSRAAADALLALPAYNACSTVFVAPDNCLEYLREQTLRRGIRVLMTTYGIRRGFWLLDPNELVPKVEKEYGQGATDWWFRYASTLDGMERVGRPVTLEEIVGLKLQVGLMVTGTGAINERGIRFGKGHGFFDLEWAMLFSKGVVDVQTVTVAVVHDCQVLSEELVPEEFDTVCDLVVTPTRVMRAEGAKKPTCGILWDRLEPGMLEGIPPLQELRACVTASVC